MGILLSGVYALMSFGLSIVYGVMKIVNFAHGALVVMGGYITYWLFTLYGVDPFMSLLVTIPILFIIGLFIQRFPISRMGEASMSTTMLLMFGIGIILEVSMLVMWKANFRAVSPSYSGQSLRLFGLYIPIIRLGTFLFSMAILIFLYLFLQKTKIGKGIRATMQSRETALILGVDVAFVSLITFGIAAGTAGAAGTSVSLIYAIFPAMHYGWMGKIFCIVVLGGLGSMTGTFVASFILAISESIFTVFWGASWSQLIAYAILVIVLVLKPEGLFGAPEEMI